MGCIFLHTWYAIRVTLVPDVYSQLTIWDQFADCISGIVCCCSWLDFGCLGQGFGTYNDENVYYRGDWEVVRILAMTGYAVNFQDHSRKHMLEDPCYYGAVHKLRSSWKSECFALDLKNFHLQRREILTSCTSLICVTIAESCAPVSLSTL